MTQHGVIMKNSFAHRHKIFISTIFLFLIIISVFCIKENQSAKYTFLVSFENPVYIQNTIKMNDRFLVYIIISTVLMCCIKIINTTVSDSNKNPLTRNIYRKSVYQSFHPNSNFG